MPPAAAGAAKNSLPRTAPVLHPTGYRTVRATKQRPYVRDGRTREAPCYADMEPRQAPVRPKIRSGREGVGRSHRSRAVGRLEGPSTTNRRQNAAANQAQPRMERRVARITETIYTPPERTSSLAVVARDATHH